MKKTRLIDHQESFDSSTSSITDTYLVECDVLMDTVAARAAVAAMPVPVNYWIWKLSSKVVKNNPLWHEVEIEYQIPTLPNNSDEPNPLLRESVLTSSYDEYTEAYFKDADDKLVINSSGERFENFPMRRFGNLILQVAKNFSDFPAVAYDNIKFTRNQVAVTIKGTTYAIGTLLFLPATVAETVENVQGTKYHYFATTFRLLADKDKHLLKIDDRGYFELDDNKELKQILKTKDLTVPKSPWPLDGKGHAKPKFTDDPAILTFTPYPIATWGIDFS